MPHDFDIRDEIDALLKKLEATMDESAQQPSPEQDPHEDTGKPEPARKAEAEATYMESPTISVYVFDASTPPPSSPFARWQTMPAQRPAPQPSWESEGVVEGTLVTETTEQTATGKDEDAIPVDIPPPPVDEEPFPARRRLRPRTMGLLLTLAVVTLVALLIGALYVVPQLTASASITLIPVQTPVSASSTLSVVTSATGVSLLPGQVPGRLLSTLTLSGERTVATTGIGHQEAQAAHGTLTFYNAALYVQTIPTGTLLTGADGVQVVTDTDAVIPAGSLATNGQITVGAHAVQVGPAGNIGAGDIYGPCCRLDMLVQNTSAFVGGQNARTYPMVTHSDIRTATTALTTSLTQSVQAALSTQVHANETLIVPVPCTPQVRTSQQVGEEATHVTVQVSETCMGETYDTQAVEGTMSQQVTHTAQTQLGDGYTREGPIQVTVQHVSLHTGPRGGLTLEVTATGVRAYQFTTAQLDTLAARLTGLSREQATAVLLSTPGVSQVAMQVAGNSDTLPTDASRIHLLVLYQP